MEIKDIAFIGYPVTDVARARDFYENILGLTATMAHEFPKEDGGSMWWIEYEVNGVAVALSDAWPPSGQSGPSLAFEVDDLDAWSQALKSKNVEFEFDIMDTPVCRFFSFRDPDGNSLTMHQHKAHCD